ncbi:MAG: hypothetical protein UX07_C0019G0004 [Parcubacteria group bacterium GW2011_GWA2_45_30]|nr:MAG: hypothetical protein UX07_C0019G0004 [Parcubacteria group bacterium GW2011_GWA2_45_30]
MNSKLVAIIFGGGGYRGAAQVGWLKGILPELVSRNIPIGYLGGASVGALNAGKLAEARTSQELLQKLRELETTWLNVEKQGPSSVFPLNKMKMILNFIHDKPFLDGKTLWDLLYNPLLAQIPFDTAQVVQSSIQLDIFMSDRSTGQQVIFSNRDPHIIQNPTIIAHAIVASCSISLFFPSIRIGEELFGDCGYIRLDRAIEAGCDTIIILLPYRENGNLDEPKGFASKLFAKIYTSYSSAVHELDREKIASGRRIAEEIEVIRQLQEEIRPLIWKKSKRNTIDEFFRQSLILLKDNPNLTKLRIIPLYITQQSETLTLYKFAKGDISRIIRDCEKTVEKNLKEILSM